MSPPRSVCSLRSIHQILKINPEETAATLEWWKSDGLDGTSGQREEECMVPDVIVLDVFGCFRSSANSRGGHSQGSHPNGATRDRGQVRLICTSASRGSMRRGAACGLYTPVFYVCILKIQLLYSPGTATVDSCPPPLRHCFLLLWYSRLTDEGIDCCLDRHSHACGMGHAFILLRCFHPRVHCCF